MKDAEATHTLVNLPVVWVISLHLLPLPPFNGNNHVKYVCSFPVCSAVNIDDNNCFDHNTQLFLSCDLHIKVNEKENDFSTRSHTYPLPLKKLSIIIKYRMNNIVYNVHITCKFCHINTCTCIWYCRVYMSSTSI